MQRRLFLLWGSPLILILAFSILFLAPNTHVNAQSKALTLDITPTTTPDPNQILQQTIDAKNQAVDAKNSAVETVQGFFNYITYVVPAIGAVIAIISGILVFFGYDTRKSIKETTDTYKQELENYKQELKNIEKLTTQVKQAEEKFDRIDIAFASLRLGDILYAEGKREMAIEAYKEARKLRSLAIINYSLGKAYSAMKQYDAAIQVLEEAYDEKPDSPQTSKELGLAYRRRGEEKRKTEPTSDQYKADYVLAARYLERAILLDPEYEDALGTLGGLNKRLANYQTSLDYYLRAYNAAHDSSYALGNIASIYWYQGRLTEAHEYFERTKEVASKRIERNIEDVYWDYYDRALAQLALKQKQAALDDYNKATSLTPVGIELESVLDNLLFLQSARNPKEPIEGLDEVIEFIKQQFALERIKH
jgi:tetratricopeptide (TPR) repeat protein